MEGRTCSSDLYRNTSEELFIRTMMESNVGLMQAPTMEMLGFKNNILSQTNFRTDSEELFKTWLNNGENHGHIRPRQASRRISTELASLTNHNYQSGNSKANEDTILLQQSSSVAFDSSKRSQYASAAADKELHAASNLFLAKAWFHSSQPMTRSRSSELRRRYAAMQSSQTPVGIETMSYDANCVSNFKQYYSTDAANNGFNNNPNLMSENFNNNNDNDAFISPSNSSSSTDKISSVVNMLKGTLERKKQLVNKEATIDDSSYGYYHNATGSHHQEVLLQHGNNIMNNHGQEPGVVTDTYNDNNNNNPYVSFDNRSSFGFRQAGFLQTIEESLMEGLVEPVNNNTVNASALSREPSQSESSIFVSSSFDVCEDPYVVSMQAPSVCESSMNRIPTQRSPENCSRSTKDIKGPPYNSLKEDHKKGGLIRYGSVTSTGSADRGDPTKKRRVERSRKMAEAKDRSSSPAVPSDTQALLKRCENLEKEVRSLKLNLAFMNRKDSEQTKQIEELEKDKEELIEEKERLLEEIERIIGATGNNI